MNNLFVFVCSFVLSEMQFGSTFLGMGLPGPKIDVCELYERVIKKIPAEGGFQLGISTSGT